VGLIIRGIRLQFGNRGGGADPQVETRERVCVVHGGVCTL
jgi:hypothetical protein